MSACTTVEKKLVLYVYDELAEDEKAQLEAHLKVCSGCRQELTNLQRLHSAMPQYTISDEILHATRRALFYKLRNAISKPGHQASPLWNLGKLALQAGLAAAFIFLGFKLGQRATPVEPGFALNDLLTATRTVAVDDGTISPYLLGVDKITINPVDGTVEIAYNTVNDVRIQGGSNNPAVKQMLQYALLHSDDPSLQLRAVKAVEKLASGTTYLDDMYVEALGQILVDETNIGTKLAVIKILESVQSQQAKDLLLKSMLNDENQAVRIQAFKSLAGTLEQFTDLENILSTTKMDSNAYIRTKSLEILKHKEGTSL